jgi:hypothetical protein
MPAETEAEFAEYVGGRLPSLRRLALLLCHDWHRADDLVQASLAKLYVHWHHARKAASVGAACCHLPERRSGRCRQDARAPSLNWRSCRP